MGLIAFTTAFEELGRELTTASRAWRLSVFLCSCSEVLVLLNVSRLPLLDGVVEWLDADLLPFKTFPVYGDTSITFIHYDTSGCLFQNAYYIQAFTDVGLSIDTIEVLRGDYITYRPDLEI